LDPPEQREFTPVPESEEPEFTAALENLPVTLCIAAACHDDGIPAIAMCTDWKATTPLGTSQTFDKLRWIKKPKWVALMAGSGPRGLELVRLYKLHLQDKNITEENVLEVLKEPVHKQLLDRKDEYVRSTLGISYDELRKSGRNQLPESVLIEEYINLRRIDLGASLILAGFVDQTQRRGNPYPKPLICRVDKSGEITVQDHFAAIGDGKFVAVPSLLRREYDSERAMMTAVYELYEAKTLSEIISTVGENTSVDVLKPDGSILSVSPRGYVYLDSLLRKFGPKKKVTGARSRPRYFRKGEFS
jgi:hypothetical protein